MWNWIEQNWNFFSFAAGSVLTAAFGGAAIWLAVWLHWTISMDVTPWPDYQCRVLSDS